MEPDTTASAMSSPEDAPPLPVGPPVTADPGRDEAVMARAIEEAAAATAHGDVPVGAVALLGERVIAVRHNERELRADPTAHAEILAIRLDCG